MKKILLFLMFALFCIPWAANAQTLFSEGFEGGSMPTGWTTDGPGTWSVGSGDYSTSTGAGLGTYNALIKHSATGNVTKLITPEIDLSSVPSATLSFMHVQRSWAGDIDELRVYYRTSSSETWTQLVEYTGAVASWTTEEDIMLPNTSATYQLAFEHTDKYGYGVGLDQVVISAPSACPKPTLGAAENITEEGASFQWTENGSATQWQLQYSTSADFTNPTTIDRNGIPAYAITGLNSATAYYAHVRSYCGDGEWSDWSNTVVFRTLCGVYGLPYAYGFEDAGELECWIVSGSTSTSTGIVSASDAPEGSNVFRFYYSERNAYLISPVFDGTSAGLYLTFPYMNSSTTTSYTEQFQVGYTTNATETDPTAFTYSDTINGQNEWVTYENVFPANTKRIAIKYIYTDGMYLRLDDFHFEVPSSCRKPSNLTVSEVGKRTATLSWTENGEATAWNLMVNGELIENVTNPYTLTGLTPETSYTVQVSPVCEEEKWSNEVSFTTLVACPAPTALEVVPTPVSATVTWTGDASNYTLRYGTCAEPDPTQPATIIFHADDIWHDGSGYQMLLDADATAYGTIIPETGALSTECSGNETIYAEFEYKLPANADGECSTSNVVIDNTITLQIPAGTYDWCITNPTPGDRIWIASAQGNVGGRADDYVFEGGMTYEFNMYMLGSNDATDVTIMCSNVDWTTVNNATSPYTINGLNPETEYYVGVQTVCGGEDGESFWTNTSFTTPSNCETPSALNVTNLMPTTATLNWTGYQGGFEVGYRPVAQGEELASIDFDDSSMGGWTTIDADGDGYGWILGSACDGVYLNGGNLAGTGHNSSADLVTSGSYSNVAGALTPDNYLVSPQVELGGSITFWAAAQDASYAAEVFGVAVSTTSNTDASAFTTIQNWTMAAKSTGASTATSRSGNRAVGSWYQYTVDLSDYAGQTGYVAIRHYNCTDQFLLNVDDITIYGPAPEEQEWTIVSADAATHDITGLTDGTAYEWQVRGVNSSCDGGYTEWSEMGTFTTPGHCDPFTSVLIDALTATSITLSWTGVQESYLVKYRTAEAITNKTFEDTADEQGDWTVDNLEEGSGWEQFAGYFTFYYTTNPPQTLISPELTGLASNSTLAFDYVAYSASYPETFKVGFSTTDNSVESFTWGEEVTATNTQNFETYMVDVPDAARYFAIQCTSYDAYALILDNFVIGQYTEAGEWNEIIVDEPTVTIDGLTPETDYEVYVQGICGEEEYTQEIGGQFTTPELTTLPQTIALQEGTNWVSFYVDVTLDDLKAALVAALPAGNSTTIEIQSQEQNIKYQRGRWVGQLTALDMAQMYKIIVSAACEVSFEGMPIDPSTLSITIKANGTTWIAYPYNQSMPVSNLFAGFAVNNDEVASFTQSVKYNRGRWVGQLTTLEVGQGYTYTTEAADPRTFTFLTASKAGQKLMNKSSSEAAEKMQNTIDQVLPRK